MEIKQSSEILSSYLDAEVIRTEEQLYISWSPALFKGPITIYWSYNPELIATTGQFLILVENNVSSITIENPDLTKRIYLRLQGEDGMGITVAERRLPLQGASNFRDLGGYRAGDGRKVKWGYLFRAEELANLTAEDILYLQQIGLKYIYDYRTRSEASQKPDPQIEGATYQRFSALAEDEQVEDLDMYKLFQRMITTHSIDPERLLIKANEDFITFHNSFQELFQVVLRPENLPLVNHCTAGKDRTGMGSALLLLALGVPEETVMQDYLSTNSYRREVNQQILGMAQNTEMVTPEDLKAIETLLTVQKDFLQAGFNKIHELYGSFVNYFEQGLHLTAENLLQLQAYLLEA